MLRPAQRRGRQYQDKGEEWFKDKDKGEEDKYQDKGEEWYKDKGKREEWYKDKVEGEELECVLALKEEPELE